MPPIQRHMTICNSNCFCAARRRSNTLNVVNSSHLCIQNLAKMHFVSGLLCKVWWNWNLRGNLQAKKKALGKASKSIIDDSHSDTMREREQAAESMAALLLAEEAAEHQSQQSKMATKRKIRDRKASLWALPYHNTPVGTIFMLYICTMDQVDKLFLMPFWNIWKSR